MQAVEMALFVVDAVDGPPGYDDLVVARRRTCACRARCTSTTSIARTPTSTLPWLCCMLASAVVWAVTILSVAVSDFEGVIDIIRMEAPLFRGRRRAREAVETLPAKYQERRATPAISCDLVAEADVTSL